ncbi:MAG: transposase [Janthinobacterium lividum]
MDGTRLRAVNSRRRNFTQQKLAGWIKLADERIEEYLARLDRADQAETEAEGAAASAAVLTAKIARMRERRRRHTAMLVASGESQKSLTDPDARGIAMHPKVGVGYNAQVAVDARHKLIVEQHVTNAGSDLGLLAQTADAARELLGVERIAAVADKGYYKGEDIAACETVGVIPYVARPERGPAIDEGYFAKSAFRYDAEQNCYTCPARQRLDPFNRSDKNGHRTIRYGNRPACRDCALKPQCTSSGARTIERWEGEAVLDRMAERLAARPDILDPRRETVEHPFGSIKQWMNQGAFLMRGLASVNAEFSLTALAHNLRRTINILGIPAILRAIHA